MVFVENERQELSNDTAYPLQSLTVYITDSCNLKCQHCWIDPCFNQQSRESIEKSRIVRIVSQIKALGLRSVKITGGEPLLISDIFHLIRDIRACDVKVILETNATLITEKACRAFKDNDVFVSVSLDSLMPERHDCYRGVQGAFNQTMRGIDILKKNRIRFEIITCLYKDTMEEIDSIIAFADSAHAMKIKINPIIRMGRALRIEDKHLPTTAEVIQLYKSREKEFEQYSFEVRFDTPPAFISSKTALKNWNGCDLRRCVSILSNGEIALCGLGYQNKGWVLGNIYDDDISTIWQEHGLLKTLRSCIPIGLEGICGNCIMSSLCLGQCRASAFNIHGSLIGPFDFCQEAFNLGLFPKSRLHKK